MIGITACAKNLGVSKSALSTWRKLYEDNEGNIPTRAKVTIKVMMPKKMHV